MPRVARIVLPGLPHHVTQRGNNRQDVFFVEDDRRVYLTLLGQNAARYGLQVLGYCLMTNHVHLVAVPSAEGSLAKAMGRTNFIYTQYVNRLHGRSGHLWQNRFFSCALDEAGVWLALAYVDRNPVRAGLVRQAWEWPWSSAAAHLGQTDPAGLIDPALWQRTAAAVDYPALVARAEEEGQIRRLRRSTHTGRPLGDASFLDRLEAALGNRLRPLPIGRPKTGRRPRKARNK
jgi:putative transposase